MTSSKPRTAPRPTRVEEAIAKARRGRVRVSPAVAVEMAARLYSTGDYARAERVCRQLIAARPDDADAHNILGVSLAALGRTDEAVAALERATRLNPEAASYHSNRGDVLRLAGRLDDAVRELKTALELDPRNARALNNLGIVQYERKQFVEAVESYRRALAIDPQMAEALNNLGNAVRLTGDVDAAIDAYRGALAQRAVYPEAHNNLGTLLQQERKLEEAEQALRTAIAQNPRYADAYNNLASLLSSQKREVEALELLAQALAFAPDNVQTLLLTGRIQLQRNYLDAAEQAVRLALELEPESAEALTVLGQVLHDADRFDEAVDVLERAVRHAPDNAEALNFYGVALKSVGRLEQAREQILQALRLNGSMYSAYANVSDLIDFSEGAGEQLFKRMEEAFAHEPNVQAEALLPLHFAYGKALDDSKRHEEALDHYLAGNRIKRAQVDYDEAETHRFFDSIEAAFPREAFEQRRYAGIEDERPVFIVGMPRSGSTLVEQILSSHPDVHGAGEVKHLSRALGQVRDRFPPLPRYPVMMAKITTEQLDMVASSYLDALAQGAGDAKRITDKLLTNYLFVGLIHLLFPEAKVIHTVRDPIDTCLSGFTKLFKDDMPHSYDLAELGRYYRRYRQLMDHWQSVLPEGVITTVAYEDVVADTEKEARRLVAFLGLPWDDKCIDFHKSQRPVKTASLAQVRKPIYKTSVQRWKKYGTGLQPLVDAIDASSGNAGEPKAEVKENA